MTRAAAKLAGEFYCRCFTTVYGLETVRLRFFNIFGPRQDASNPYSGVIALFSAALAAGRVPTIHGDGLQSRDFVYVTDAVQALVQAAEAPTAAVGNVYNRRNEKQKVYTVRRIEQIEGIWTVMESEMTNSIEKTRTELVVEKMDYNVGLKESDFSRRELESR